MSSLRLTYRHRMQTIEQIDLCILSNFESIVQVQTFYDEQSRCWRSYALAAIIKQRESINYALTLAKLIMQTCVPLA